MSFYVKPSLPLPHNPVINPKDLAPKPALKSTSPVSPIAQPAAAVTLSPAAQRLSIAVPEAE